MASLPLPGNGHKSFSIPPALVLKSSHKLSLTEMAFGRNIGTLRMRERYLFEALDKLLDQIDKLDQDYVNLLSSQSSEGSEALSGTLPLRDLTSCALRAQERFLTRASINTPKRSSSLRTQEKDKRPLLGVSPKTRTRVRLAEADSQPGFQRFWSVWKKRVAKQDALKAWLELNPTPELEDQIVDAVKLQFANNFADDRLQYAPHPATWLRAERWTDEIIRCRPMTVDEQLEAKWAEEDRRASEPPLG